MVRLRNLAQVLSEREPIDAQNRKTTLSVPARATVLFIIDSVLVSSRGIDVLLPGVEVRLKRLGDIRFRL